MKYTAEQYLERIENKRLNSTPLYSREEMIDFAEKYAKQLLIHSVSQQRELLGCNHDQIRVDGKDVGTCVKCSVKMEKAWQPNCG